MAGNTSASRGSSRREEAGDTFPEVLRSSSIRCIKMSLWYLVDEDWGLRSREPPRPWSAGSTAMPPGGSFCRSPWGFVRHPVQ
jgi:hypothetical protein